MPPSRKGVAADAADGPKRALAAAAELLRGQLLGGSDSDDDGRVVPLQPLLGEIGEMEDKLVARGELRPGDAALIIDYEWNAGDSGRAREDAEEQSRLRARLLRRCVEAEKENRWLRERLERVDAMLARLSESVARRSTVVPPPSPPRGPGRRKI